MLANSVIALPSSNAGMLQLIVKRRGSAESLSTTPNCSGTAAPEQQTAFLCVAPQRRWSLAQILERVDACTDLFLAEKVRQKVLRYFCLGLVEQLTSITVLEGVSTSQQLEMDMISLLCSASVKFETCGQVSDRAPSLCCGLRCHAMPAHRVEIGARASVLLERAK